MDTRDNDSRVKLSKRQAEVLEFIEYAIRENGYPPTIREIAGHMDIKSTNGVTDHLKALQRKGFITRDLSKSRAIMPVDMHGDYVEIPILGRIAAGLPLLAEENIEDRVRVDSFFIGANQKVFGLKVVGDSMIGDGIFDGDYIFVRKQAIAEQGAIAVVMVDDSATVKRYFHEGDRVRLQPSNPDMEPIYVRAEDFKETSVIGIVVGVFRKM